MKKIKYIMISAMVLIIQLSACKKYLEEKSDKSLVIPESVQDLQGILDDNQIMNNSTPSFGEASADDYFLTIARYNSLNEVVRKVYTWDLSTYIYGTSDWRFCYGVIYNANYCLEQIEKANKNAGNEAAWNNVKGSAVFYRAYYFLNLVWEYGKAYDDVSAQNDLGIPLRLTSDMNIPSVRASVKSCYEQVIKDASDAADYLPDYPTHVMRPSKAAAYGLLARCYLSMRDYDNALKYADLCLQLKNDLLDYNSSDVKPALQIPFLSFNKEIIFYTNQSAVFGTKNPVSALIDSALYASYANNDMRKSVFFLATAGYWSFKGSYSSVNRSFLFSGIATDEMYLTRAECYARKNNKDVALQDLNALLLRRWKTGTFIPVTAASAQDALNIVLTERRKQLLMRGLRWIDIKRLNKEGRNIMPKRIINGQTYMLNVNENRYALPLPDDIIKITGMPQNPR